MATTKVINFVAGGKVQSKEISTVLYPATGCVYCGEAIYATAVASNSCAACAFLHGNFCTACYEDAGNGAGGYSNCCNASTDTQGDDVAPHVGVQILSVGLIEGRHPLPVDHYLLLPSVTDGVGFHGGLKQAAHDAALNFLKVFTTNSLHTEIRFYPTGLTIAAAAAIETFKKYGCVVYYMSYDRETDSYVKVRW